MRIAVLFCCLALVAGTLTAQQYVYVPDNNPATGGSNAIPFWAEWSAIQGQIRYQLLFSPAELGNRAFTISDLAFAAAYDGSFSATQLQIRLSHSTVGTLNATMDLNIPNPVVCFNGPSTIPTTNNAWVSFGLTGGFAYNGTDFLVVDLRYMGGVTSLSGTGSQGRFRSAAVHRSWAYGNYNATVESGQDRLAGLKTRFTVSTGPGPLNPGDLIVTYNDTSVSPNFSNTLRLDPLTNKITTLIASTVSGGALGNWVQMGPKNREVWIAYNAGGTNPAAMYKVDRSGTLTTIVPFSPTMSVHGFRLTDDGGITWSSYTGIFTNNLIRTDLNFGNPTTLVSGLPSLSLSHQEIEDTGLVVASSQGTPPAGAISVIDPVNSTIVKTVAGLGNVNTIDFHKGTGKAYATEFGTPSNVSAAAGSLFEFDVNTYKITSLIDATTTLGATVDRLNWIEYKQDHTLYLGARHKIFQFDLKTNTTINTWVFESDRLKAVTGATVYGNRQLMLDTSGGTKPGGTVGVNVSFADMNAPGASYYVACSLGLRPGIKLGTDTLDLAFDVFFFLSANNLVPGVFQNFQGTLDKNGQAAAKVQIPALAALDGTRFFCGTIAIINSAIVVGNSEGFTIRK